MSDDPPWANLGFEEAGAPFESPSQNARVWTESWVSHQLFCPSCGAPSISRFTNNRPVADFECTSCREEYELKSQKGPFGAKVVDGAYGTMMQRLSASNNPNLLLMNYDLKLLAVTDLMVVPKQFFIPDIIEERKPLAVTARRAGWIGCNILLGQVPQVGKIFLVRGGQLVPKDAVLYQWRSTLFLRDESVAARGWLIDVMKCVELIGRPKFTLDDVYAFEGRLSQLYPGNNNVRPKIRQQLQVLRDQGFLEFVGRGSYRLRAVH
jgi:type II restriction enzyme